MNTDKTHAAIFQDALPELLAIPPGQVRRLNVVVATAMDTIAQTLRRTRQIGLNPELVDRLERHFIVFGVACDRCREAEKNAGPGELLELSERAYELRDLWLDGIAPLLWRKVLDTTLLECGLRRLRGYQNVAWDLQFIAAILIANWATIEDKCCFDLEELEAGNRLAVDILRACSRRRRQSKGASQAVEVRDRAFTLLAATYHQVRRATELARWNEGDADAIAPSLFSHRRQANAVCSDAPVVATAG